MKFQKAIAIALSVAALLTMTACGSTGEPAATTAAGTTAAETAAAAEQTTEAPKSVSGTVSLAGSTSMQKLCEAMIESFSEEYPDITVTAEYTGSGAGLEAVAAAPGILSDPAPAVQLTNYGASSIEYTIFCWCSVEDYWPVYFAVNENLRSAFANHGVEMTYDHLNVHVVNK